MAQVHIRARAREDILESANYLEREGGVALAERFIASAQESFEILARMPKAGVSCGFHGKNTRYLRRWPIRGFEKWLIFYLPKPHGVEIVHVMHGARNIEELLS